MKSISCALALVALVLSSSVVDAAHQTGPSRSRSHHTQLASSLAKKSTRPIERRATPSGWTSQGCVTEGNNGRVLTGYSQQGIGSLTVESCLATCASMAYAYGGVECESDRDRSDRSRGWMDGLLGCLRERVAVGGIFECDVDRGTIADRFLDPSPPC